MACNCKPRLPVAPAGPQSLLTPDKLSWAEQKKQISRIKQFNCLSKQSRAFLQTAVDLEKNSRHCIEQVPPELSSWCDNQFWLCHPLCANLQICLPHRPAARAWKWLWAGKTDFVPSAKPAPRTHTSRKSMLKVDQCPDPYTARAVIQGPVCHPTQVGKKCTAQHNRNKNTKSP